MNHFSGDKNQWQKNKKIYSLKKMRPVGFEPTPPKRTELESAALDHSATNAKFIIYTKNIKKKIKIY